MTATSDFSDVLAAAHRGEGWAFDRLYREWNRPVTGFLRARGVLDVEGGTNDVFLKAFRSLASFTGDEAGFRSWIFRIARNQVIDEYRRQQRQPQIEELANTGNTIGGGDVVVDAERRLGDERVMSLLSQLTDEQREVLTLRIVADLTIDQIAAMTGRRRGAVKQLQRRALRRLEGLLADEGAASNKFLGPGRTHSTTEDVDGE